jgi:RNA polymerase sigma-70 factor (ECF subfamily)
MMGEIISLDEDMFTAKSLIKYVLANKVDRIIFYNPYVTEKMHSLYQAVKNASLNALKKKNVKDRYADSIMPISSEEPQVLENLIKSEVYGNLHAALQSLPKGCRKVVRLSYFDGLKNDEISQMLNVSVNTVKTQKKRALQLLRLRLNSFLILFFLLFGN